MNSKENSIMGLGQLKKKKKIVIITVSENGRSEQISQSKEFLSKYRGMVTEVNA